MGNTKASIALLLMVFFLGASVKAQLLEIPVEELPSESVVPALDSPRAVQSRLLTYSKRWGFDLGAGWLLDEPFYTNQFFSMRAMYNWSETSGFGFKYFTLGRGVSDYGKQFSALNFLYGHGPETGYAFSYESRFIYGKVSFGKHTILPISFQSQFDLGTIQYGARNLPYLSAGVGNNLFFTPNVGINLMVRFMVRQAFDSLSQPLDYGGSRPSPTGTAVPSESDFTTVTRFGTGLDFGMIFLF